MAEKKELNFAEQLGIALSRLPDDEARQKALQAIAQNADVFVEQAASMAGLEEAATPSGQRALKQQYDLAVKSLGRLGTQNIHKLEALQREYRARGLRI